MNAHQGEFGRGGPTVAAQLDLLMAHAKERGAMSPGDCEHGVLRRGPDGYVCPGCGTPFRVARRGRRPGRTGYRGVVRHPSPTAVHAPYWARITVGGVRKSLGMHATAEDAARAYDQASRELTGGTAGLNFPQGP